MRGACGRRWMAGLAVPLLLVALPGEAQVPRPRAEAARGPASKRTRPHAPGRLGHTVRAGDTVWTIARRHSVSVEALVRRNRLQPGQRLRIGQVLTIPGTLAEPGSEEPSSLAEIVLERPPPTTGVVFSWPVPASIASPFGPRRRGWHGGVDVRAERGTPIRAAAAGMVITSGREIGYGGVVKIWHYEDLMTVYAHTQENYVRTGDWVEQGQVVALVGATGRATAPHLHFEIRLAGKKYDPLFWLPVPVDVAAFILPHPDRIVTP